MMNIEQIKQKIISILNEKGPSLPVPVSREIELSPTFASAILAELVNEREVKMSNLKVGGSPLYLIPGQEQRLEEHSDNLVGIEKSAFLKLKETKFLEHEKQEPALRVALSSIKDFAIPFKFQEKIYWKYSFTPDEEVEKLLSKNTSHQEPIKKKNVQEPPKEAPAQQPPRETPPPEPQRETTKKLQSIFEKEEKKKNERKPKENFLDSLKNFLERKNIRLISLEQFDKKIIEGKVNINEKIYFFTAFNKKRITEQEIIKVYKKASLLGLNHYIITKSEPTKKMKETTEAYKKLLKIDVLE